VVAKDNTVVIANRTLQIGKTRFRHTLAGSTVTVHEHLDGGVSIRFGPHVVGRYTADQEALGEKLERAGKGGRMETGENQKQVSSAFHTPLEIPQKTRDSHFPTAPSTVPVLKTKKAARAA
jgi:hypothetical protein